MTNRFLCVCQGGNCRSVSLAYVLKYDFGQDALACGWEGNRPETVEFLCSAWEPRYIILLQQEFLKYVPERFHAKVRVVDVGPDRFGHAFNPELLGFLRMVVLGWKQKDWEI